MNVAGTAISLMQVLQRGEKTLQDRDDLKLSVFMASKLKLFSGIFFLGLDDFILLYVTPMPHC